MPLHLRWIGWDCLLHQLRIKLLPALHQFPHETIIAAWIVLMIPLLIMSLNQALRIQMESNLGIDGLLGTFTLEWNKLFKDISLRQIDGHGIWWRVG